MRTLEKRGLAALTRPSNKEGCPVWGNSKIDDPAVQNDKVVKVERCSSKKRSGES